MGLPWKSDKDGNHFQQKPKKQVHGVKSSVEVKGIHQHVFLKKNDKEKLFHEGKLAKIKIQRLMDDDPDLSYLTDHLGGKEYTKEDNERLEAYNNDQWHMIGIRAEADVVVDGVIQHITSGGLWGIESDSDEDYLKSVEKEEIDALRGILEKMGIKETELVESKD